MYLTVIIIYAILLISVGYLMSKKHDSNAAFFAGNHASPWYLVAFGMIGASVSGISVVSVPGMVRAVGWTYLQTCIGFLFGYIAVAYVLLPLYYSKQLTSIYEYLKQRFGQRSRLTGAMIFIIAKTVSSASKLYIAVLVLQQFIFKEFGIPFWLTVVICVIIIWAYTYRSGIRVIVWTDALQTLFLIVSVIIMCVECYKLFGLDWHSVHGVLKETCYTQTFLFDDWESTQNFWKQFVSGIFIVVVMTGLDQDMMQKNLSCKTLKQSQTNMLCYGAAFIPVNLILLLLGAMIILYAERNGIILPEKPDDILPWFVATNMSSAAGVCFILGIVSATFSSADSALTSITTSLSVDVLQNRYNEKRQRIALHSAVCTMFALLVITFGYAQNSSIIDTIYTIVGYGYGPLLGLFSFGMFTKLTPPDRLIPVIAVLSPVLCYAINIYTSTVFDYRFGYELLLLNGIMTFAGLYLSCIFNKKLYHRQI